MPAIARPIRVLHLAAADIMLFPILRDQLRFLRDQGYVIETASIDGPLARRLRDEDGFTWSPLPLTRELAPLADWRASDFIADFCRKGKYDIVHTHTPKGNVVGQWAARKAEVPIVLQTLHGFYFHDRMGWCKRRLWMMVERFSAKHSDHILCQNPEDVVTAIRENIAREDRISLLGNGIDLARFRPDVLAPEARTAYRRKLKIPEDALVVGMCGRFVAEKGFPEFLEAGRALLEKHPKLHLLAIGHRLTSERPREAWTPEQTGLPPASITVLQDRDDLPELYACMDVNVLPSHREGFPRVLMEGAASGLPQVGTQIRGCRQTIIDNETGFLVPVKDVPALAAAVAGLLDDPGLRKPFGQAARKKAERQFDQQRVFEKVAACYKELLANKLPQQKAKKAGGRKR